jgi:hypothetical protein
MKISFIICYSSTWPMTVFDNRSWPESDLELDKKILYQTNTLIKQILSFKHLNKQIILVDNSDDFVPEVIDPAQLKIVKGTKITSNSNQAKVTAEAYNIGMSYADGTHYILQHNDTQYLTNYYHPNDLFVDLVKTLDEFRLEYITIDAKPSKISDQDENFYADCYWFLCKSDFYKKHDIDVDYLNGDNNHQATITCLQKGLKFLHLPGYYELNGLGMNHTIHLRRNYSGLVRLTGNVHSFLNTPFLYHYKGGTGLKNLLLKHDITN